MMAYLHRRSQGGVLSCVALLLHLVAGDGAEEIQHSRETWVSRGIDHRFTLPLGIDHAALAQNMQVSRDGGLWKPNPLHQFPDTQGRIRQRIQQQEPINVSEGCADIRLMVTDLHLLLRTS